ncbi:hypothetical protein BEL05_16160 [Shewanella colwelliana]|uniref:YchJ-like middle NTF2-like domain-containing protein n=1 Tax=Shewanella colwelliana TaxID=23 RepID=A0A1E5IYY2_SHECO|nr:YchJ family metal-binding protein [Shewanella colwelliana]OEG72240.1 hypothetical protein BEL05_04450 [Shewanella colwelliana]OEG75765.1 hypothetical protein BEL05_16160 [Shewanella colwelliana]
MNQPINLCPCGQDILGQRLSYAECCHRFHQGDLPSHPELLMRSRYSAFVLRRHDYLIATHHPDFLNGLTRAILDSDNQTRWHGLQIINAKKNGQTGLVTFQAWYLENGKLDAIHEVSQFKWVNGKWLYTEGQQFNAILPKRNEPCLCHSGKKFKQCCIALAN